MAVGMLISTTGTDTDILGMQREQNIIKKESKRIAKAYARLDTHNQWPSDVARDPERGISKTVRI
jgi:hypothetical protein